jgi:hypothetical protein
LFSKYKIARDLRSVESGAVPPRGKILQRINPAMITAIKTNVGTKSFFRLIWTVSSLDVRCFLSGTTLSVVGFPFSMLSSSRWTSQGTLIPVHFILLQAFQDHLSEVAHPAHILMKDLAGQLHLVLESLDGFSTEGDLGF